MRVKNGLYNILFGLLGQLIAIAVGIVVPRLTLVNLGSESNGLLSSVFQVFTYVALLEAGVGIATLQALYKPVSLEDHQSINEVLAATNKYYKRTGLIYFICVIVISFIYPLVVTSSIDYFTVFTVIMLQGMTGVISFTFQGKYKILLQAEGKNYILTNLTTIINVLTSVSKIVLLSLRFNVVALQTVYFLYSVLQMLFIMIYIRKRYKWLDLKVKENYDAISQKNSVLLHQISGLIFNNTDILILTIFCDLKVVSVYAMYSLLFGMINTILSIVAESVKFALGQEYNTNYKNFLKLENMFEVVYMGITFSLFCIANYFVIPFMKLYTYGVKDINYIDVWLSYLFITVQLLSNVKLPCNQVISFSGYFKKTQWGAVIEAIINLMVSLILVNILGIYGVLLGTIAALLYRANDMIIYVNKYILKRSSIVTYRRCFVNLAMFILITSVSSLISLDLSSYKKIILWASIYSVVTIILFTLTNFVCERKVFTNIAIFLKRNTNRIFNKLSNEC